MSSIKLAKSFDKTIIYFFRIGLILKKVILIEEQITFSLIKLDIFIFKKKFRDRLLKTFYRMYKK